MSESMARKVRNLQADLFAAQEDTAAARKRIGRLEAALEKLLWRLNKEGDGPLPDEAVEAERVLKNG